MNQRATVRFHDLPLVDQIRVAAMRGFYPNAEIQLQSPSAKALEQLVAQNPSPVPLHSSAAVEAIDAAMRKRLRKAGRK